MSLIWILAPLRFDLFQVELPYYKMKLDIYFLSPSSLHIFAYKKQYKCVLIPVNIEGWCNATNHVKHYGKIWDKSKVGWVQAASQSFVINTSDARGKPSDLSEL